MPGKNTAVGSEPSVAIMTTIEIEEIKTEEGATYTPFTDGWGIGYKVSAPGKPDRWICLYPSQGDDLGVSNVFVYLDEYEPNQGVEAPCNSVTYIAIWDDETDGDRPDPDND